MGSGTSNSGAEQPGRPHGIRALIETVVPRARFGDQLAILSGTGQNVAGLALYVVATFAINILISRSFGSRGPSALGIVTLATQFAFVGAAATRFGMDAAALRRVAIDVGKGEPGRVRGVLGRAAWIAALWSVGAAALAFAVAGPVSRVLGLSSPSPLRAAALALPFVALCQVYLGGTRGLKIMRYTLYIYWADRRPPP